MIEQVGDVDEEDRSARLDAAVGDGRGEVGLAQAVGTCDNQPSPRLLRVLPGLLAGGLEGQAVLRTLRPAVLAQRLEREPREMA